MTQPLKILQIVPSISLVYGGPSQMVRGFSQALAATGAEVTIITTDANGDVDEAPLAVPLSVPVPEENYTVYYFRCSPFRRYKFSLDLLRWLWDHAQDYDIAHVHALFSPVSSLAATVLRQRRVPYLMRPLGTLDPADLRKKQQIKKLYAAVLERPNLAAAAAIHFTSEQEARVSERFGTDTPGIVLPLGVSPLPPATTAIDVYDRFDIPRDRPLILFMSRLDPKKGIDLLLPALETLQQTDVSFHLVMCGANPQDRAYEQSVYERVENSALRSHVTLTGYVAGDTKAALLQAADLFVLPSYYENFGISVAEAMLAAIPVVISDQVHIWETIQQTDSGWICECTVESVTTQLQAALQSPEERTQRGLNAQRCAKDHYSWGAIAESAIGIYQNLLAK
ncbi:hormogonium polysaccharide biosynthesis glycosyltransferase HpsP [Halomicronema sp. CCY15110]|uniref:hormogonium polysaccharide biosynthesis glycosyltransferase HpsP n=1 Tax=Halomicronema sp. CCY15110 TaxID=2767773 RepID=UPI00194ECD18|nr:hormogonium polysaccharide biosynthesis glycosyltransferase HpsP [Halomicronema sp. CCY15110]